MVVDLYNIVSLKDFHLPLALSYVGLRLLGVSLTVVLRVSYYYVLLLRLDSVGPGFLI